MQVLNIVPNVSNTVKSSSSFLNSSRTVSRSNFSPRLLNQTDTVTFGRKDKASEGGGADNNKTSKKGFTLGRAILMSCVALLAFGGGIQTYNQANHFLAQIDAENNFNNNPKNVALDFINTFVPGGSDFGGSPMHFEYSGDTIANFFEIKKWDDKVLGPDSVVSFDFNEGVFSSTSLDIDGDRRPEITVTVNDDGKLVVSYDFDSDGRVDTVETLED